MSVLLLSKSDFKRIAETAFKARQVQDPSQLPGLMQLVSEFVPHEYSSCGHFSLMQHDQPGLGHSSYNAELCQLYMTQGLTADPAVLRLATTRVGQASSQDDPTIVEPRSLVSLKLDFGIRTCLSVAVRGLQTTSLYLSFSNFDERQKARLAVILEVMAPHLYLAYMHAFANWKELESMQSLPPLTNREREIMNWAVEGKSNWEISMILHLSLNTIKYHMKNIFRKLQVENRWAAVAHWQNASGHGFLPSSLVVKADQPAVRVPSPPVSRPPR